MSINKVTALGGGVNDIVTIIVEKLENGERGGPPKIQNSIMSL